MPSQNVFHEFKMGQLHSGSKTGPLVKSRAQELAIYESEKRKEQGNGGVYPEKKPKHLPFYGSV